MARAFQRGVAHGLCYAISILCERFRLGTVVLSGGVFQNELLLKDMKLKLTSKAIQIWTNQAVPPNDGGISLGQAALAVLSDAARS
jgi:hydrogenase maturation protein HypF